MRVIWLCWTSELQAAVLITTLCHQIICSAHLDFEEDHHMHGSYSSSSILTCLNIAIYPRVDKGEHAWNNIHAVYIV